MYLLLNCKFLCFADHRLDNLFFRKTEGDEEEWIWTRGQTGVTESEGKYYKDKNFDMSNNFSVNDG